MAVGGPHEFDVCALNAAPPVLQHGLRQSSRAAFHTVVNIWFTHLIGVNADAPASATLTAMPTAPPATPAILNYMYTSYTIDHIDSNSSRSDSKASHSSDPSHTGTYTHEPHPTNHTAVYPQLLELYCLPARPCYPWLHPCPAAMTAMPTALPARLIPATVAYKSPNQMQHQLRPQLPASPGDTRSYTSYTSYHQQHQLQ